MKKFFLVIAVCIAAIGVQAQYVNSDSVKSDIQAKIVSNNTKAITADVLRKILLGLWNFETDSLWMNGNTIYYKRGGIAYPVGAFGGVITAPNTTLKYWNGYKQFVPLNTDSIPEGTKQFFTAVRARLAISGLTPVVYDNVTGQISVDTTKDHGRLATYDDVKLGDSTFAKNDLTATGNRTHDWNGYNLTITNAKKISLLGDTFQLKTGNKDNQAISIGAYSGANGYPVYARVFFGADSVANSRYFSDTLNGFDATDINSGNLGCIIYNNGVNKLVVERRYTYDSTRILLPNALNLPAGNDTLRIEVNNGLSGFPLSTLPVQVSLRDYYLNTLTPIPRSGVFLYPFVIDGNSASRGQRFTLVYGNRGRSHIVMNPDTLLSGTSPNVLVLDKDTLKVASIASVAGPTPTLQSVTSAGSSTTNGVTIGTGTNYTSIINSSAVGVLGGGYWRANPNSAFEIGATGTYSRLTPDYVSFFYYPDWLMLRRPSTMTGGVSNLYLPDGGGGTDTVARLSDVRANVPAIPNFQSVIAAGNTTTSLVKFGNSTDYTTISGPSLNSYAVGGDFFSVYPNASIDLGNYSANVVGVAPTETKYYSGVTGGYYYVKRPAIASGTVNVYYPNLSAGRTDTLATKYDVRSSVPSIDTSSITNFHTKVKSLFSATAPLTYSNGLFALPQANTSTNGYLSSSDWNNFNNKPDSVRFVNSGLIHTTPAAFSLSGKTLVITQTLANQSAYTLLGRGSGTGAPSFISNIDSNWVTGLHSKAYYDVLYQPIGSYIASTRTISTTYPLQGGGDFSANRTFTLDTTVWHSKPYYDNLYRTLAQVGQQITDSSTANAFTLDNTNPISGYTQTDSLSTPIVSAGKTVGLRISRISWGPSLTRTALGDSAFNIDVTGLNISTGKTLTVNNSMTLAAGADGVTLTGPSTSATLAGTNISNTWTQSNTYNNTVTFASTFGTGGGTGANNFFMNGGGGGITIDATTTGLQFGGNTNNTSYRGYARGGTSSTIGAGNNFANFIFGRSPLTLNTSGVSTWGANIVVSPISTLSTGGGTVTNLAALLVDSAYNGINAPTNTYAFAVRKNKSIFMDTVYVPSVVSTDSSDMAASTKYAKQLKAQATGVTPGTYTNSTITVAANGAISFAATGTGTGSQIDSTEKSLSATQTWTGTAPTGTNLSTFEWHKSSNNIVSLFVWVQWGTAGTTNTSVKFNLPSEMPAPRIPVNFSTTGDIIYQGSGYLNSSKQNSFTERARCLLRNQGSGVYELEIVNNTSVSAKYAYAEIRYVIP